MGYQETKARDPDYWNRRNRKRRDQHPELMMLHRARRRARAKDLPFDLELEDIIIPDKCPIFGIPLIKTNQGRNKDSTPTLDRIRGPEGYIKGNVEVISWRANRMKGEATPQELRRLADYYEQKSRKSTSASNKERIAQKVRS